MRFLPDEAAPFSLSATHPAVELWGEGRTAPALIICDHASNAVPGALDNLGLAEGDLNRHIGWDIGAAVAARRLADQIGATAVLSRISRLVIDCNRPLGHPTSICAESDGILVPGNRDLDERRRRQRAEEYFYPYHGAVCRELNRVEAAAADRVASLVAVHSFTPMMNGFQRPWHVGVLWNRDPRLARPLIDALRTGEGLCVGDNEPYSGRNANYTVGIHGAAYGRPHVSIEIRQDLIADEPAAVAWGDRLARILGPLLALPENRARQRFSEIPA
ncbi:MAG: N-formylglutamate amidohydrolase [Telmatospirillum sp.]|nr:N-formylglutamate amidohydrolase [Telmatospirillum sp.]